MKLETAQKILAATLRASLFADTSHNDEAAAAEGIGTQD